MLKVGDNVCLKGDSSTIMTVINVTKYTGIQVAWLNRRGDLVREVLPPEALETW